MEITRRLYYETPEAGVFTARRLQVRPAEDGAAWVALDQTAFFPTGGGQPHDTGTLDEHPVLDVREEGQVIWHRVEGAEELAETVKGAVDWTRRTDHRQQHTGQHILSRALVDLFAAETVGFHLGGERCSIDLNREVAEADLEIAEARANEVVLANLPVTATVFRSPDQVPVTVRKEAPVEGDARVVAVGEFDATFCCGTHCAHSGSVGPIKLLRSERKRGGTRVEFVCGFRALSDYRLRHRELRRAALLFTTGEFEVAKRVGALQAESKALRGQLETTGAELRAMTLAAWQNESGAGPVFRDAGDDRASWLPPLATGLAKKAPAMVVSREGERCRVALATPEGYPTPAGAILRRLADALGGKGGGAGHLAQGSFPGANADDLRVAWEQTMNEPPPDEEVTSR